MRAAIAPVIAENMSDRVEAITRAVNVEAFMVWSAYRINVVSRAAASSCSGSSPESMYRKFAACGSLGCGGTMTSPVRIRWYIAISVGVFAMRRTALRSFASGPLSQPSGSYADAAEMPVRSIDIGDVCSARVGINPSRKGETSRSETSRSASSSSSGSVGSRRLCRR